MDTRIRVGSRPTASAAGTLDASIAASTPHATVLLKFVIAVSFLAASPRSAGRARVETRPALAGDRAHAAVGVVVGVGVTIGAGSSGAFGFVTARTTGGKSVVYRSGAPS